MFTYFLHLDLCLRLNTNTYLIFNLPSLIYRVPPIPSDTNKNDSWKGSSSDSDINNSTNTAKSYDCITSDVFRCDGPDTLGSSHSYTSKLTHRSIKIPRKCRRLQKNESKVVSKEIVPKKTITTPKNKVQVGKI